MSISIRVFPCARHTVLPLLLPVPAVAGAASATHAQMCIGHHSTQQPLPSWPVGTLLYRVEVGSPLIPSTLCNPRLDNTHDSADAPYAPSFTGISTNMSSPVFRVVGRVYMPHNPHAQLSPLLEALEDITEEVLMPLRNQRQGRALAWITLSDKGHAGQREDLSGPAIEALVRDAIPLCHAQGFMLPDDANALKALLVELALGQGYDLICTTGGTGLGPRDVSPEATLPLLEKRLHGFEQAMMQASLAKTPHAAISRAVAGVLGRTIIINLPGSRKAVVENLAAVIPPLGHAMDKLHGDPADCGG